MKRTWLRRLAWTISIAILAAVAIPIVLVQSLHFKGVRERVTVRISRILERELGAVLRAEDFDVHPWSGFVEIRGLALHVPGHPDEPFLTAAVVRARLDVRALLRGDVLVGSLRVEQPRFDLEAPRPVVPERPERESGGGRFEVRSLVLDSGEIASAVARLYEIAAKGSFSNGRAEAEVSSGKLHVALPERPMDLEIAGSLSAGVDGAFEVRTLDARGSGLTISGRAAGSFVPHPKVDATYDARSDLALLASDLFAKGTIAVSGTLAVDGELARPRGTARFDARDVSASKTPPALLDLPPALRVEGTDLGAVGEVAFDLSGVPELADLPADRVRGNVTLAWSRGATRLVDAEVRSDAARYDVRAALFPEAAGKRTLEGEATLGRLTDPASIEIASATLRVVEPNAAAAVERLGYRVSWPGGKRPEGSLDATMEAKGPILAPQLQGNGILRDGEETLAIASAGSVPGWTGWSSGVALDVEAAVLPGRPGKREATARIHGSAIEDGVVRIEEPDLGAAVQELVRRTGLTLDIDEAMLAGPMEATALVEGPVSAPLVSVDAQWRPAGTGSVELKAAGYVSSESPYFALTGDANLVARDVDGAPLGVEGVVIHDLHATSDGREVKIDRIAATLPTGGELTGRASFELPWPPRRGEVDLTVVRPLEGVDRTETHASLVDGILAVDRLSVSSGGSSATGTATIPLGSIAPYAGPLRETLAAYPTGPISVDMAGIDLGVLRSMFLPGETALVPSGTMSARLRIDAEQPMLSSGTVEVQAFALTMGEHRLEAAGPVRIELADGKAVLPTTTLRAAGPDVPEGQSAEVSATVVLAKDWSPDHGIMKVVEDVTADLHGSLEAAWLTRLAGQGAGTGFVALAASVRGPIDALAGDVRASGAGAKITFPSPYPTRFEDFEAHASLRQGTLVIDSMKARWNGGTLAIHGTVAREGAHLEADFDEVTYRLDYGANARIDGSLELDWPKEGERLLSGTLDLDRASVRRDIPLNGEMLRSLLEPESVAENELLATIRLDVDLTSDRGITIRNNLARLHADLEPLKVTGTLAAPLITGEAHVAPGGLLNLLGSIVRIEDGTLTWTGDAPSSPRLAMRTTTSVEDPTIANEWYHTWYQAPFTGPGEGGTMDLNADRASSADTMNAFAAGVMTYYQDRIASAMSVGYTQTEISYQPLTLFGETDTTARMTITQRLSRWATFLASSDPKDPEAQTFILDLHGFDIAPSMSAQLFTNDDKHQGATLQQTVRLGRGREESETGQRLRKVRIDAPKGIGKSRLKKAISYRTGDALDEGAEMDVEIDAVDALHRKGYPLAEASATLTPHGKNAVDLLVKVVPGPKVESEFEGDKPRRADRRAIAALYRVGEEEAESLEAIREQTARALQAKGFLDPRVEARVDRVESQDEVSRATLRVTSVGGKKVHPDAPRFEGASPGEAETLASLFPTRLSRISLATASPAADQRIVRALAGLGYPAARVASRSLSEDGKDLVVHVDPGERLRVGRVEVTGLDPEMHGRLAPLVEARPGDPIRADDIARSIVAIESELRRRGYAQATVTAKLAAASASEPFVRSVTFDVAPGPTFEVQEVRFKGAITSDEDWLEKTAGLTPGQPLDPQQVSKARGRLGRTGVFQEIEVVTDPPTARTAPMEEIDLSRSIPADVEFDLTERKRWQLAYGGRYETSQGLGIVTDLYNFNSFGRGHTTGFRGLWSEEDSRLQVYHSIPRVIGERSSLEGFLEWKKELEEGVWTEGETAWLQLTFPPAGRWQNRAYVQWENLDLTAENPDPANPLDERSLSPAFGYQLVWDSRVLPSAIVRRERGFFYGLNLLTSSEDIGSDFTGLASYQQWSFFWPFGEPKTGRISWNHSYRFDTANVVNDEIPFDDRLRAGGEFSVRGYETNSLGPRDADGNAIGGEVLFIANEELHVLWGRGVSSLVFFDVGQVWPTFQDVDSDLSASYGIGLRWASPAGPLRVDWAIPLDRRAGDPHSIFYVGFGNVF